MMLWLAAALAAPPAGWTFNGSKDYSIERVQGGVDGDFAVRIEGDRKAKDFAPLAQVLDATPWRGKRVQMTVSLKAVGVTDWAGGWMRVDGLATHTIAFDNMQSRALRGDTEWAEYTLVLDVATSAKHIVVGALLSGSGELWVDDIRLEAVPETVPVTDMKIRKRRTEPKNLGFEG